MRFRGIAVGAFVSAGCLLAACGLTVTTSEGDAGTDASTTTPAVDGAAADAARPDVVVPVGPGGDANADALQPVEASLPDGEAADASLDSGTEDAAADAAPDVMVDAADGGTSVVLGADGVIRGSVGGTIVHKWHGSLFATDARCPIGSVVTSGCCVWDGTFANLVVTNIPIVFDTTTRAGTLAGSPIGAYGVGPTEPDGTVSFQTNPSANQFPNHWPAIEEIGLLSGESAATLAASKAFKALDVVIPVIFSTSYARVRWNAARSEVTLFENHLLSRRGGGGCGAGSSGQSAWTLKSY